MAHAGSTREVGEGLIYAGLKENHIVLVRKALPPGVISIIRISGQVRAIKVTVTAGQLTTPSRSAEVVFSRCRSMVEVPHKVFEHCQRRGCDLGVLIKLVCFLKKGYADASFIHK
jgi:hypothetical protein